MKLNSPIIDACSENLANLANVENVANSARDSQQDSSPDLSSASAMGLDPRYGSTRLMIIKLLAQESPITAIEIASRLKLSPVGVRRHLDSLISSGMAIMKSPIESGKKGKGRPAKFYELSPQSRRQHGQSYARLASDAIIELRDIAGPAGVKCLAKKYLEKLLNFPAYTTWLTVAPHNGHDLNNDDSGNQSELTQKLSLAHTIASSLTEAGFTTTARPVGAGIEICQHSCPVANVIPQYHEFCAAEEDIFMQLFQQPIQRISSITDGNNVCTTFVPIPGENLPAALTLSDTSQNAPNAYSCLSAGADVGTDSKEIVQ